MILSTFENNNKFANVCKIAGEYEVMLYKDNSYLSSQVTLTEQQAKNIAKDWVLNADII
jgi:hypothetical protein